MKKLFAVLVAIVLVTSLTSAQLKRGMFGLQTGITGDANTIGGIYNLSENMRLRVSIGFASSSPSVGSSSSSFNIGGGLVHYFGITDNLATFVGGLIEFGTASSGGASSTSFGIAAQFGAEYWFSPRFSISGFAQLGFNSTGPSGATTSNFGTSMGTALTFYFN